MLITVSPNSIPTHFCMYVYICGDFINVLAQLYCSVSAHIILYWEFCWDFTGELASLLTAPALTLLPSVLSMRHPTSCIPTICLESDFFPWIILTSSLHALKWPHSAFLSGPIVLLFTDFVIKTWWSLKTTIFHFFTQCTVWKHHGY